MTMIEATLETGGMPLSLREATKVIGTRRRVRRLLKPWTRSTRWGTLRFDGVTLTGPAQPFAVTIVDPTTGRVGYPPPPPGEWRIDYEIYWPPPDDDDGELIQTVPYPKDVPR